MLNKLENAWKGQTAHKAQISWIVQKAQIAPKAQKAWNAQNACLTSLNS